jgi:hypothetical protein
MEQRPDVGEPSEHELRVRATAKLARKRAFMMSAVVLGSLIILNLYLYSQSHNSTWLLLDLVFAGILCFRAWHAFGSGGVDDQRVRQEMDRMRGYSQYVAHAQPPPSDPSVPPTAVDPSAPTPPPPPPPPTAGSRDPVGP